MRREEEAEERRWRGRPNAATLTCNPEEAPDTSVCDLFLGGAVEGMGGGTDVRQLVTATRHQSPNCTNFVPYYQLYEFFHLA